METLTATKSVTRLEREMRVARARRQLPGLRVRRQMRVDAGVTQAGLADALGVGRITVWRWENGWRTPQGDLLVRYVDLLDRLAEERSP